MTPPAPIRALVLVTADPRVDGRAREALRMAIGLTLAEIAVTVALAGDAADALRDAATAWVDERETRRHLATLEQVGATLVIDPSPEGLLDLVLAADRVVTW